MVFRIQPGLPVQLMETYSIHAPRDTHFRVAECREIQCAAYEKGWKTLVDERTELGQQQAHYIRKLSGREFKELCEVEGLTTFLFPAGQKCFREHQTRIDRPELFTKRGGDWRGATSEPRVLPPYGWVDEMQENFERLRMIQEKG